MTLQDVAERLHCSTKTVRRRIQSGELRAAHIARGRWEISEQDLAAYLEAAAYRPRRPQPTTAPAAAPIQPNAFRTRRRRGDNRTLSDIVKELAA